MEGPPCGRRGDGGLIIDIRTLLPTATQGQHRAVLVALQRRGDRMRRREFIAGLGAVPMWPLAARAQQAAVPVIGFLNGESAEGHAHSLSAFRQGLSETGYVEGRNVAIEYRWANDQYDRLPALAADLVRRQVDVIVAVASGVAVRAAKAATTTIPVVFTFGGDPVGSGFVASLNRPGGNLTGVTTLGLELLPKRLELLRELMPRATNMALLYNPATVIPGDFRLTVAQAAARKLGLDLHVLNASSERDFDDAFATLGRLRADGLLINTDPLFLTRTELLAGLALRHAVPAIFQYREFAAAGGLMSYGGSSADRFRLVGVYTGRILKGEKPANLPVQQSPKVELIINLKTAKALGITFPLTLLARAEEVIE
jgi:putative tryptophan/tyrosine transport system substrate-binding protein